MVETTVAKKIEPQDEVCQALSKMESQFKMALPKQVPSERFIRVAQTAIRNKPELLNSDRMALYGAFHECAADGLLPDGKEASIIMYKGKAKYSPMVGGICKKARNSGEIKTIDAIVVYDKDFWEKWNDEKGAHFRHVEAEGDRGLPRLTYAYVITKDEGFFLETINEKQMEDIEASSTATSGPWKGAFKDEMRRKSALRRLCKYRVPSSKDLDDVIRRDDDMYELNKPEPKAAEARSSRLSKVVETTATSEPIPSENKQEQEIPFGK